MRCNWISCCQAGARAQRTEYYKKVSLYWAGAEPLFQQRNCSAWPNKRCHVLPLPRISGWESGPPSQETDQPMRQRPTLSGLPESHQRLEHWFRERERERNSYCCCEDEKEQREDSRTAPALSWVLQLQLALVLLGSLLSVYTWRIPSNIISIRGCSRPMLKRK